MTHKEMQQAYAEATNGMVASYEVLGRAAARWEGNTRRLCGLEILKVEVNLNDKRKRIGVVPFRLAGADFWVNDRRVDKPQVNRILSQSFVSQLVQTRKFTVLDREYMSRNRRRKKPRSVWHECQHGGYRPPGGRSVCRLFNRR